MVAIADDCLEMGEHGVEVVERQFRCARRRRRAEGGHRRLGERRLVVGDDGSVEVGRHRERMLDAHQPAQRTGEHGDAGEPCVVEVGEHPLRDAGLEHGLLQVVAVDEQRGEQRVEAREGTRSDPANVDRRVGEVGDDRRLSVGVGATGRASAISGQPLELDRPVRQPLDLLDEGDELRWGEIERVGEAQRHWAVKRCGRCGGPRRLVHVRALDDEPRVIGHFLAVGEPQRQLASTQRPLDRDTPGTGHPATLGVVVNVALGAELLDAEVARAVLQPAVTVEDDSERRLAVRTSHLLGELRIEAERNAVLDRCDAAVAPVRDPLLGRRRGRVGRRRRAEGKGETDEADRGDTSVMVRCRGTHAATMRRGGIDAARERFASGMGWPVGPVGNVPLSAATRDRTYSCTSDLAYYRWSADQSRIGSGKQRWTSAPRTRSSSSAC